MFDYDNVLRNKFNIGKKAAAENNRVWQINIDEYDELISSKCHYCENFNCFDLIDCGGYSLDRVDNSRGYEIDNVVACCGICNHYKGSKDYKTSKFLIEKLVEYRKVGKWAYSEGRKSIHFMDLEDYIDLRKSSKPTYNKIMERIRGKSKDFISYKDIDDLQELLSRLPANIILDGQLDMHAQDGTISIKCAKNRDQENKELVILSKIRELGSVNQSGLFEIYRGSRASFGSLLADMEQQSLITVTRGAKNACIYTLGKNADEYFQKWSK